MEIFLKYTVQKELTISEILYNTESDDTKPYENKYKSREIIERLLKSIYL
jgi:hypothetical protein